MLPPLKNFIVEEKNTVQQVLGVIEENAQGLAFVVDANEKLTGIVTDGDVRRALLKGATLNVPVSTVMNRKFIQRPVGTTSEELTQLLDHENGISHIPLTNSEGKVVDYACLHRLHQIPIMEPCLNGNELNYVIDCVKTKWISSQGKYVTRFEQEFAKLIGCEHAVAVANGTVALHLSLAALGVGPGDEVIVPDLTFAASLNSIIYCGATPVLVDVDMQTWCMDPAAVRAAITPRTKAIMPVHLYGQPCKMDELMKIAEQHKLVVVEDVAEAMGSLFNGEMLGTIGHSGCFSFFGNKMITTGEGGMVTFRNKADADRARMLRDHGMSREKRYWHLEVGFNYRMTNLQAAIGVAQLEQFEQILKNKLDLAKNYDAALKECQGVTLPPRFANQRNINWLYTILVDEKIFGDRDSLMKKLLLNGIETRPVFYPLHEMPPYQQYTNGRTFPNSIYISRNGLSLPSSAMLSQREVQRISNALFQVFHVRQMAQSPASVQAGAQL